MKSIKLTHIFRGLTLLLGVFALSNGIVLIFTTNLNWGSILTLLLGAVLTFWSVKFQFVNKVVPKFIRICAILGLAAVILFIGFLLCYGNNDCVTYKEDAIIVLGAAVHGEEPSLQLKDRLNSAVEYHQKNPDALIIVSGGQGAQEDISEAEAMKIYLINKGVNEEKIITEDQSTSTYENFIFSKEILEERFGEDYDVCFTTTEYHIFRACQMADSLGYENIKHMSSGIRWHSICPSTLREVLAVLKFGVLGF